MPNITIHKLDYADKPGCENLIRLLDNYASDPMGGGEALPETTKTGLCEKLAAFPGALSLLAFVDDRAVGFSNCFTGFSTFAAQPLLNIHDIAVEAQWRGHGIASRLMEEIAAIAVERGCCKVTLEVLSGNQVAKSVYEKAGFQPAGLDPTTGSYEFWERKL